MLTPRIYSNGLFHESTSTTLDGDPYPSAAHILARSQAYQRGTGALPAVGCVAKKILPQTMSCSVHIIRQLAGGGQTPITLEEWNAFVEADPDLKRPEPGHLNYSETLALLPSASYLPDDWQWLLWDSGSISSDYPQQPMLKKIGQIARHFDAVVMNDEGEVWSIDGEGRVSIPNVFAASSGDTVKTATATRFDTSTLSRSLPPPLPVTPAPMAPQPWYLNIRRSGQPVVSDQTKALLAEALLTSLEHYPVSLPIANLEQASVIAEQLKELGHDVEVSGYDRTKEGEPQR
jgi:hypothetical protein